MGLFDFLFKSRDRQVIGSYFKTLTAYQPVWRTTGGGVYEALETRAAINAIATHCSKLKPHVTGSAGRKYERMLQVCPNPWQNTAQFLERLATIYEVENTAFIVPIMSEYDDREIVGLYPVLPSACEVKEGRSGRMILKFTFPTGQSGYIDYERVGVLVKMQYRDDFFGAGNDPLRPTMQVIGLQNQVMMESMKQGATPRFMAKISNSVRPEDLKAERKRFVEDNLGADNNGGVMIFDTKYSDVKQIATKSAAVDAEQMKLINDNVNKYFGTNDKILRNEWDEETWNAFYEGKVEPFAIKVSMVICRMLFSDRQIAAGNGVEFSANRLQFATVQNKLSTIVQMFDRGMLSRNEGREILQMPGIGEQGNKYFIRGEYVDSDERLTGTAVKEADDSDPPEDGQQDEKEEEK